MSQTDAILLHQTLHAFVDFKTSTLQCSTSLVFQPATPDLAEIVLNARDLDIHSVRVNRQPAACNLVAPLSTQVIEGRWVRDIDSFLRVDAQNQDIAANGQLRVTIPMAVRAEMKSWADNHLASSSPPADALPGPLVVEIDYTTAQGVEFVSPCAEHPRRAPHAFTTGGEASRWFPCAEFGPGAQRCTFELQLSCDSHLTAFASGDLGAVTPCPQKDGGALRTHVFRSSVPLSCTDVGWVVGLFADTRHLDTLVAAPLRVCVRKDGVGHVRVAKRASAWSRQLAPVCESLQGASEVLHVITGRMRAFRDQFIVFVEDGPPEPVVFAGLIVAPVALMHSRRELEQAVETRRVLVHALACSWLAPIARLDTAADAWVVAAIAQYAVSVALSKWLGHVGFVYDAFLRRVHLCSQERAQSAHPSWTIAAEARRERARASSSTSLSLQALASSVPNPLQGVPASSSAPVADAFGEVEIAVHEPLLAILWNGYRHPLNCVDAMQRLKLGLVMDMYASALGDEDLRRAIRGLLESESPTTAAVLSGERFFSSIRQATERTTSESWHDRFEETWFRSSRIPSLCTRVSFNRKRGHIDVRLFVEQEYHHTALAVSLPQQFTGPLEFHTNEFDGISKHVHQVTVQDSNGIHITLPSRSKMPRNRTRKEVNEDQIGLGEYLLRHVDTPLRWVHVDRDAVWMRPVVVIQSEMMCTHQLFFDPHLLAQLDAIDCLRRISGTGTEPLSHRVLVLTLRDTKRFHGVRSRAALAIAEACRHPHRTNVSVAALVNAYQNLSLEGGLLRRNRFADLESYFVLCGVCTALGVARAPSGLSPPACVSQLLGLLRDSDNSREPYNDYILVSCAARALGNVALEPADPLLLEVFAALRRLIDLDTILPSFQLSATRAALAAVADLIAARQLGLYLADVSSSVRAALDNSCSGAPDDPERLSFDFLAFARRQYPSVVRAAALSCALRVSLVAVTKLRDIKWLSVILPAALDVVKHEKRMGVRHALVRGMLDGLSTNTARLALVLRNQTMLQFRAATRGLSPVEARRAQRRFHGSLLWGMARRDYPDEKSPPWLHDACVLLWDLICDPFASPGLVDDLLRLARLLGGDASSVHSFTAPQLLVTPAAVLPASYKRYMDALDEAAAFAVQSEVVSTSAKRVLLVDSTAT